MYQNKINYKSVGFAFDYKHTNMKFATKNQKI